MWNCEINEDLRFQTTDSSDGMRKTDFTMRDKLGLDHPNYLSECVRNFHTLDLVGHVNLNSSLAVAGRLGKECERGGSGDRLRYRGRSTWMIIFRDDQFHVRWHQTSDWVGIKRTKTEFDLFRVEIETPVDSDFQLRSSEQTWLVKKQKSPKESVLIPYGESWPSGSYLNLGHYDHNFSSMSHQEASVIPILNKPSPKKRKAHPMPKSTDFRDGNQFRLYWQLETFLTNKSKKEEQLK